MNKKPEPKDSLRNTGPRLYEIGRHGAFDISTTHPHLPNYASIHPVRPDMDTYFNTRQNLKWLAGAVAMAVIFIMGAMLISSAAADIFLRLRLKHIVLAGPRRRGRGNFRPDGRDAACC